jgi:uncharacterized protein YkwD
MNSKAAIVAALAVSSWSAMATAQDLDGQWLKLNVRGDGVQIDLGDDSVRKNGKFSGICYMHLSYDAGLNVYTGDTACEIAKNVWTNMIAGPSFSLFSNDGGIAVGAYVYYTNRTGGAIEGAGTHILTPTYSKTGTLTKISLAGYGVLAANSSLEPGVSRFAGGYQVVGMRVLEKNVPDDAVSALAPFPAPDSSAASEVLTLVNGHRGSGAMCGTTAFPPAPPLALDAALNDAAALHALDMARFDYFSHVGRDGSTFDERILDAGFAGDPPLGENIAAGYPTAAAVVGVWMASPGHCANIMNPGFAYMGAGHATVATSTYGIYWVQTFGGN